MSNLKKNYTHFTGWDRYDADIMVEYRQCVEEGKDVSALKGLFEAINALPAGEHREQMADTLFGLLQTLPQAEGYAYNEPSDLEGIKALRPAAPGELAKPDPETLLEKIHGAWLGRVCGCILGKCIEGCRTPDLEKLFKHSGNYPLHRYVVSADVEGLTQEELDHIIPKYRRIFIDQRTAAPSDDDTNYVAIGQMLIEKYGRDFTPMNMAELWLDCQSINAYCTAERVAFRNFVNAYLPPVSAVYKNPYREWIGAQIRGDYFGYINPGDPETAAEMGFRDASISHVKNGIYGEMFAAAMIAAAAVEQDIEKIILHGLAQIPSTSRLYESIKQVISWYHDGLTADEAFKKIHEIWNEFDEHAWCHTISNAMIVAAGLLYGQGDYDQTICLTVATGFDTDCNGATVGSVLGMRNGAASIPEKWTAPIHGKLDTTVFGVGRLDIREAALKTLEHLA